MIYNKSAILVRIPRIAAVSFFLCAFLFGRYLGLAAEEKSLLVRDPVKDKGRDFPLNFRTMQDVLQSPKEAFYLPKEAGFSFIAASGSGQFSKKGLRELKNRFKKYNLIIIDLRREPHGFIDNLPVSWHIEPDNSGKSNDFKAVESDELKRLEGLKKNRIKKILTFSFPSGRSAKDMADDPIAIKIGSLATERQLCRQQGIRYERIPVANYGLPDNTDIDRFIDIVNKLPEDSWVHFHCAFGDARTTLFMAMLDMLYNAKYASLNSIANRQWLIGGIDLMGTKVYSGFNYPDTLERKNFVKLFYIYCRDNKDGFKESWSAWLKRLQKNN